MHFEKSVKMNANEDKPSLPYRRIFILGLILAGMDESMMHIRYLTHYAANNSSIWMIFSYLPFMIKHYYPSYSAEELGYRAGILGSVYHAGNLIGSFAWGVFADKYGRRPALLYGLCGTLLSAACFGFSPTFGFAVASRFMWGALNGNLGVCKTYLSEILDDRHSAEGMAMFGVIGGVGRILGPIIGGYLSMPAESYPKIFKGTIFETFPFALPSVVVAFNCFFVMIFAYCELEETIAVKKNSSLAYSAVNGEVEADEESELKQLSPHGEGAVSGTMTGSDDESQSDSFSKKKKSVSFSGLVTVKVIGSEAPAYSKLKVSHDEVPMNPLHVDLAHSSSNQGDSPPISTKFQLLPHIAGKIRYSNGSDMDSVKGYLTAPLRFQVAYLLSKKEIFVATALYGCCGFVQLGSSEVFPLWVVTPHSSGGFGFNSQKISLVIMISGAITVFSQLMIYSRIVAKVGLLNTYWLGCMMSATAMVVLPHVSLLGDNSKPDSWFVWVCVVLGMAALSLSAMWTLTSVFVLINNSCYSHQRGTVNGIGQSFAAIGRLFGPYTCGVIFAWSEGNGLGWPLNHFLVFFFLAILSVFNARLTRMLPRSIERSVFLLIYISYFYLVDLIFHQEEEGTEGTQVFRE